MKSSKKLIVTLAIVPLASLSVVALAGLGGLDSVLNLLAFYKRNLTPGDYTLVITSSDISNDYATTSLGNKIRFESEGVTISNNNIVIAKNGYIRMKDAINGSTSVSVDVSSFSNTDQLMLQSGYNYDDSYRSFYENITIESQVQTDYLIEEENYIPNQYYFFEKNYYFLKQEAKAFFYDDYQNPNEFFRGEYIADSPEETYYTPSSVDEMTNYVDENRHVENHYELFLNLTNRIANEQLRHIHDP